MWAPCIGTLLYLSGSLLLFKGGPVEWPVQNEWTFWTLNVLYLTMFLVGYSIAMLNRHRWSHQSGGRSTGQLSTRLFWLIWSCAALVVLIGHRNLTMGPGYLPTSLPSDFVRGLTDPLSAYLYKLSDDAKANFSGNTGATVLFGLLAFTKPLLTYVLATTWPDLSRTKKLLGSAVVVFPVISGVCVGTNKPLFDVAFMLITIVAALVFMTPRNMRWSFIKSR